MSTAFLWLRYVITRDKIVKKSMEDSSQLEAEVMIWKGYPACLREPSYFFT